MTNDVMIWISAIFPLLSIGLGVVLQYYLNRAWIPTIIVFGGALAAMLFEFTMNFWPWLLLYLFLCWLGCWGGSKMRSRVLSRRKDNF